MQSLSARIKRVTGSHGPWPIRYPAIRPWLAGDRMHRAMEAWYHPSIALNDPQPEGHMASYIRRRKFLATLGGAVAAWPLAARAQQQTTPIVGLVSGRSADASPRDVAAFKVSTKPVTLKARTL